MRVFVCVCVCVIEFVCVRVEERAEVGGMSGSAIICMLTPGLPLAVLILVGARPPAGEPYEE